MPTNLSPISAHEIAEQCRRRARMEQTENMTAVILLMAHKFLKQLAAENVRLAHRNETLEAQHDA